MRKKVGVGVPESEKKGETVQYGTGSPIHHRSLFFIVSLIFMINQLSGSLLSLRILLHQLPSHHLSSNTIKTIRFNMYGESERER
jgi:hypothetical protein